MSKVMKNKLLRSILVEEGHTGLRKKKHAQFFVPASTAKMKDLTDR